MRNGFSITKYNEFPFCPVTKLSNFINEKKDVVHTYIRGDMNIHI